MKQRGSAPSSGGTRGKVKALRAYLAKLQEVERVDLFDVDPSFSRGGVRVDGGRLGALVNYCRPELLLHTSRDGSKAVFIVVTETAEVVDATLEALDTWLQVQARENESEDISKSLRVLQSAGSRLSNRVDQSQASKALNTLKRLLVEKRASAA